jgi:hypothetical protein
VDVHVIESIAPDRVQNDIGRRVGRESQKTNAAVFLQFPGGGDAPRCLSKYSKTFGIASATTVPSLKNVQPSVCTSFLAAMTKSHFDRPRRRESASQSARRPGAAGKSAG